MEPVELAVNEHYSGLHCSKDALTDFYGCFMQVFSACLAFTCLIGKRFCEPVTERRSWLIWFYDTSKQGLGALVIHLANVYLAEQFHGDPCTWYIINFLLDSSIGLFIIYIGIRLSQYLARVKQWEAINFGEYGKPPSMNAWLAQCCVYVMIMIVVKICMTLLIQLDFWDHVRDFILSPINNPKIELAFVMLIIPFFVNMLMFWVTDNFLMHRSPNYQPSLLERAKVHYRSIRVKNKYDDSESDVLMSADEELLDSNSHDDDLQHRSEHTTVAIT